MIIVLISCLTHSVISFLSLLLAESLLTGFSVDGDFVVSFSTERIEMSHLFTAVAPTGLPQGCAVGALRSWWCSGWPCRPCKAGGWDPGISALWRHWWESQLQNGCRKLGWHSFFLFTARYRDCHRHFSGSLSNLGKLNSSNHKTWGLFKFSFQALSLTFLWRQSLACLQSVSPFV